MAVTDVQWDKYPDLLQQLSARTTWSDQANYQECKTHLESYYSDLDGLSDLLGELDAIDGDKEETYKTFRIVALAYPAEDGQSWVSFDFDDNRVCVPSKEEVYTRDYDAWDEFKDDVADEPVFDEENCLWYDDKNYYLEETRQTIVHLDADRNYSYDDDGKWYVKEGQVWKAWEAEPAAAVPGAPPAVPKTGLEQDPGTKLWYDTDNYYLDAEGLTVAYPSADSPGYCYDDIGNWYEWDGNTWKTWQSPAAEPAAETVAPAADTATTEAVEAEEPVVPGMTKEELEKKEKAEEAMAEAADQVAKEEAARTAAALLLQQVLDKAPMTSVPDIKGALAGISQWGE